jgi:hypothetical protein
MEWKLSRHARDVITRREIAESWIEGVLRSPTIRRAVGPEEVHLFGTIEEMENRCLKVVLNPGKNLIITVYFDRKMRKRGCK